MYKASIIIPIDNNFALLDNFFNSLFTSIDKSKYEIIVVDDNCDKHSVAVSNSTFNEEQKIPFFIFSFLYKDLLTFTRVNLLFVLQ